MPRSGTTASFYGHPRGLLTLSLVEGTEIFSLLGMQSLLVLYLTHDLLLPGHVKHVLGFATLRNLIEAVTGPLSDAALASQIFGLYSGLVFLTPLLGGLLADRWLGRTRAIVIGTLLMAAGHLLMAFNATFVLALALLMCGVGCFKSNVAGQVGALYAIDDTRRANAFLIYQNFINVSAIISPLVCGTLGEKAGWHYGFGAAGVVMLLGLVVYLHGRKLLPASETGVQPQMRSGLRLNRRELRVIALLVALLPLLAAALIGNDQMYNAYVVWGKAHLALQWWGWAMPVTWLLSLDAVLAVVMTFAVLAFWRSWARRWREPDEIVKIAYGAGMMALAPLLLALADATTPAGVRSSLGWAFAFHVVNETGFAMLAPVTLALYSRAAPARLVGLMLGVCYTQDFFAYLAVGRLGGFLESMSPTRFWLLHSAIIGVAALGLALVARFGRALLAPTGDDHGPAAGNHRVRSCVTAVATRERGGRRQHGRGMPPCCGSIRLCARAWRAVPDRRVPRTEPRLRPAFGHIVAACRRTVAEFVHRRTTGVALGSEPGRQRGAVDVRATLGGHVRADRHHGEGCDTQHERCASSPPERKQEHQRRQRDRRHDHTVRKDLRLHQYQGHAAAGCHQETDEGRHPHRHDHQHEQRAECENRLQRRGVCNRCAA